MYVLRDYYRLSINFEVLTKGEDYLVNELQSSNLVMKRPDLSASLCILLPCTQGHAQGYKVCPSITATIHAHATPT